MRPDMTVPRSTACLLLAGRRFLSASSSGVVGGRGRAHQTLAQISMHQNHEERWNQLPIPKENIQFRVATLADKAEVLAIDPGIHYGLDYLEDYYDEIVAHESRCGLVAVDKANNKILNYVYAIVNEGGRNLSFGGGRTLVGLRDYGLMSSSSRAIFEHLRPKMHSLAGCCGVYNLPTYTRGFFEKRRAMFSVALHNQQLGFEADAAYWSALADRFSASPAGDGKEPRLGADAVDFLTSPAVCSPTENRLFKPDQHLLIAKESLLFSQGNLLIWQRYLQQVLASHSGSELTGEVTGVSIGNWNSVPAGGYHVTINIYCRTEACAVSHLVGQLRSAAQRLRLRDPSRDRLYISAYVPSHLLYNEVLSGVRLHPLVRDLPQSCSPKLACDIRVGSWTAGTFF